MNTSPAFTLAQLLEIENDPALLEFQAGASGLLLWPQVRTVFLRFAMSDLLYGAPLDGSVSAGVPKTRALVTFARSALHNARQSASGRARADVCIWTSGIGNQTVDGKLLNRLSDHFALAHHDRTVTVEDHFHWKWPTPRHNERVLFHAPLQAANAMRARLAVRDGHVRQASALIDLVATRGQRVLGWRPGPQREQQLVLMLARKAAGMEQQLGSYRALLERIEPKLILMIGACYGPASTLIRAARDLGIITAEYQHGTIAPGHDAYNFAPTLRDSAAYRATLPDHFLSYGTWWHDRINAPVRMTAVGNPHRTARLGKLSAPLRPKEDLLILADGTEFDIYVDLARKLAPKAARQGLRVVLRPHPLERVAVEGKYGQRIDDLIQIDQNADLYQSLGSAHAVVSELSTGIFEAVGVVDKVFMWDTPKARFCFPQLPFDSFTSTDELVSLIGHDCAGRLDAGEAAGIWAGNWQGNYAAFLGESAVDLACGKASNV